jgi:hypothetical protein
MLSIAAPECVNVVARNESGHETTARQMVDDAAIGLVLVIVRKPAVVVDCTRMVVPRNRVRVTFEAQTVGWIFDPTQCLASRHEWRVVFDGIARLFHRQFPLVELADCREVVTR